jgi:hypothetical protein
VAAIRRSIQATLHPPTTEDGRGLRRNVDRQRIRIQKTGLAGVALLSDVDLDADQFGLVAQHGDKARMGNRHKILVVALP